MYRILSGYEKIVASEYFWRLCVQKVSFVIPCYKSEFTLEDVVSEIIETIGVNEKYEYEIILVNDCSTDSVFQVIEKLALKDGNIKGINLAKNFGQHSAIMAGLNYVTGDIVICLDDDGQTPANEMFKLIDKINSGYNIVFAKFSEKKYGVFKNASSKVNDKMAQYFVGKPKKLTLSSYFACRRFVVDEVVKYKNSYPYLAGLLLRTTNNIENVNVIHRKREIGTSSYSFTKLISLWLNGFTAFSVKPLRFATIVGTITALSGFLYGLYTTINRIVDPNIPMGYSSIMAGVVFIGGMIMLILGMIGEYIGRIYICINNSPQYVIKDTINMNTTIIKDTVDI